MKRRKEVQICINHMVPATDTRCCKRMRGGEKKEEDCEKGLRRLGRFRRALSEIYFVDTRSTSLSIMNRD